MEQNQTERQYRMYFLAPYNISAMQVGCQNVHGKSDYETRYNEYAQKHGDDPAYIQWSTKDHVVTFLNGGTTNRGLTNPAKKGTMDKYLDSLIDNGVKVGFFYEEDLNDALTSICFLADDRVSSRKLTPTEKIWKRRRMLAELELLTEQLTEEELSVRLAQEEAEFEREVGGKQNAFLRRLVYYMELSKN